MLQDKFSYLKTFWKAFKRWSKMGKRGNIKKKRINSQKLKLNSASKKHLGVVGGGCEQCEA